MSTVVTPKYAIGDAFYAPSTDREKRTYPCPDCLGEKEFKVIAPSGDEYTLDCPRCSGSTWLRDVPSLTYDHHVPKVITDTITGYCVNEHGEVGVKYRGNRLSVKEGEMITDEAVAFNAAEAKAAELNAKAEVDPVRIHHKKLGGLQLREASHEQFKSGLYDSWSSFRFLRELVDEIIEDSDHSYGSRSSIVEALEDKLQNSHRYEFIFKGFTRAMEAVVALVNADDEKAPEILAALRAQWAELPEQTQNAWQPNARIATDWSGKPCPTY